MIREPQQITLTQIDFHLIRSRHESYLLPSYIPSHTKNFIN